MEVASATVSVRRIGVGLVGYGLSGSTFHAPLIAADPRFRLVGVSTSRAEQVRRELPGAEVVGRPENLFGDPRIELVVVATPNATHVELATAALLADKHVVVDKPFTIRAREADELIALAERRGRLLSVYQNRRWDADFQTVRRCVGSGVLGRVVTFIGRYDRYVPRVTSGWREEDADGSGVLYDLGSHLIDQAIVLFGAPRSVWGEVRTQRSEAVAPDCFHAVLGYRDVQVILHAGSLVRDRGPRYEVHGDRGSFLKYGVDTQEATLKAGGRPGDPGWGLDPDDGRLTFEVDGLGLSATVKTLRGSYEAYYGGMARAILEGTPPPVSAGEARNVIRVIEYVLESHARQRQVETEWASLPDALPAP